MTRRVTFSITMQPELADQVKQAIKDKDITFSQWARALIREELRKQHSDQN